MTAYHKNLVSIQLYHGLYCNANAMLMCSTLCILEYCLKYAKPEDAGAIPEENSSDEELSEDEYESSDEAVLGPVDP